MSEDIGVGSAGYNIYLTLEICKQMGHIDKNEDADTAWDIAIGHLDDFEGSDFNDLDKSFQDAMILYLQSVPTASNRESAAMLLENLKKSHDKNVIKALKELL